MESILGDLVGFGASVASGGILGVVGSVVGGVFKWLNAKEEKKERDAQRAHEVSLQQLQMQARREETEQELELVEQEGSWSGLSESIRSDSIAAANSHKWVNDVRSLYRPFLTTGLIVLLYIMFRDLMAALQDQNSYLGALFSEAEVHEIIKYVIYSVAFAATTSIVWWFGDRAVTPPAMKGR